MPPSPKTRPVRPPLLRWGLRLLALLGLILLGFHLWWAGHLLYWKHQNPTTTRFMELRKEALAAAGKPAEIDFVWVPYARISPPLKRAVVAAEDDRFMLHDGFDWEAMERALERNLKAGRIRAGGSTISNQLAKNLFLTPARTPWRKLQEWSITVMMEAILSKRRILEIYLNVIEWGRHSFGAQAAARYYFGVDAADISEDRAALLAAIIPNPRHYDKAGISGGLLKKTRLIRERMRLTRIP